MQKVVVLDSNILIYILDDTSEFSPAAINLLKKLEQEKDQVYMSCIARTEILSKPYSISKEMGDMAKDLLDSFYFVNYIDVTRNLADEASKLMTKAGLKLKNIDSIHLATALSVNANVFWTNDDKLSKVLVTGLKIKVLSGNR